jgi:hypothetical protein
VSVGKTEINYATPGEDGMDVRERALRQKQRKLILSVCLMPIYAAIFAFGIVWIELDHLFSRSPVPPFDFFPIFREACNFIRVTPLSTTPPLGGTMDPRQLVLYLGFNIVFASAICSACTFTLLVVGQVVRERMSSRR